MDIISSFINFFLHLDTHLITVIQMYGGWIYAMLFVVIFCETGIIIMSILPGDSLLFAAGAVAATGSLDIVFLILLLIVAAILGDQLNYYLGKMTGKKIFKKESGWLFNKDKLLKTKAFYEKHGPKTIILARFIPFARTFAPFVAGIGEMHYPTFALYNIVGGILWVISCTLLGYLFGNIPVVKDHFEYAILGIVLITMTPVVIEWWRHKKTASHS